MDAAPPPARPPETKAATPWPRSAQLAAAFLLGLAIALLGVYAYGSLPWSTRPTQLEQGTPLQHPIDLNKASRAELRLLPGVGPVLAERIETYRSENDGFHDVEELRGVHGIGPANFARLREWVTVEPRSQDDRDPTPATLVSHTPAALRQAVLPSAERAAPKKAASLSGPIDVNRASAEELRTLPGIGPKMSQAIVDERAKAPFKSVDELRRVRGIGPKTLDRLRSLVTVRGDADRLVRASE